MSVLSSLRSWWQRTTGSKPDVAPEPEEKDLPHDVAKRETAEAVAETERPDTQANK